MAGSLDQYKSDKPYKLYAGMVLYQVFRQEKIYEKTIQSTLNKSKCELIQYFATPVMQSGDTFNTWLACTEQLIVTDATDKTKS